MAVVTTKTKTICESVINYEYVSGRYNVDEIIEQAAPKIFDFPFPIYDETHRLELEKKILRRYYMREIGAETVGLWKLFMEDTLNEIMPKYNILYEAQAAKINPAYNIWRNRHYNHVSENDVVKNATQNTTTNGSTTTENDLHKRTSNLTESDMSETTDVTGNRHELSARSDTPQGAVGNLENYSYLSEAENDDVQEDSLNSHDGRTSTTLDGDESQTGSVEETRSDTGKVTDNSTENGSATAEDEETLEGFYGKSYAELVREVANLWVDIDNAIVKDMSVCFLSLWYPATTSY